MHKRQTSWFSSKQWKHGTIHDICKVNVVACIQERPRSRSTAFCLKQKLFPYVPRRYVWMLIWHNVLINATLQRAIHYFCMNRLKQNICEDTQEIPQSPATEELSWNGRQKIYLEWSNQFYSLQTSPLILMQPVFMHTQCRLPREDINAVSSIHVQVVHPRFAQDNDINIYSTSVGRVIS